MNASDVLPYIPFISALTALLAVGVGPFITLRVAHNQIAASRSTANLQARANVLSKSRQDWINSLRAEIAGFMSLTGHALPTVMHAVTNGGDTMALTRDIRLHLAKTTLMINPKEEDHVALLKIMRSTVAQLSTLNFDVQSANDDLASIAQRVLKREWERVKAFE